MELIRAFLKRGLRQPPPRPLPILFLGTLLAVGVLKRELGQPDARLFQILFLGTLLGVGVLARDFSISGTQILLTFAFGISTQLFWIRRLGLKNIGLLSALITCLGTCLLLSSDRAW